MDAVGFLVSGPFVYRSHERKQRCARGLFRAGSLVVGNTAPLCHPGFRPGNRCGASLAGLRAGRPGRLVSSVDRSGAACHFCHRPLLLRIPGPDTLGYFALCLLPLLAMGIQNAPTRTIGKTTFHTTYVTGVLDTLGESLARFFIGWRKGASEGSEHLVTACRAAAVWICYVMGALAGSAGLFFLRSAILFVPICLLVFVSAVLVRRALQFHRLPHPFRDVFQLRHYRHQQIIRHGHEPRSCRRVHSACSAIPRRFGIESMIQTIWTCRTTIRWQSCVHARSSPESAPIWIRKSGLSRSGRGRFNAVPSHQAAAGSVTAGLGNLSGNREHTEDLQSGGVFLRSCHEDSGARETA